MPYQLNEVISFEVVFRHTADGQPFLPTDAEITVIAPDGTVTTAAATRVGTTFIYARSVTADQAGNWTWFPVTTDEDITPTTYAAVEVGQVWVDDIDAPISGIVDEVWDEPNADHEVTGSTGANLGLLPGINSRTQAAAINITTPDTNVLLNVTQTVTYSAANGNRKQVNVSVSTDPTGCTVTWTFVNGSSERTYTGSLISYNSSTGIAVVAMDTFTATKAGFPVGAPTILAQQSFSVALALPASAGNLVPVGFHSGKCVIQAAG